jgi:sporulation protein YlmC with PRC-barrel domain
MMDVVRDVLDKSVVDRNGREMGRVDGLLLEQRAGEPPRLAAILIGPAALGLRLHPRLERPATWIERWLGIERERPVRIDFDDVDKVDDKVRLRLTMSDTPVAAVEQRLRDWIVKLPGSG